MVRDPLSLLDALMVAMSGFIIVFIMLALLWGIIIVISRAVAGVERRPASAAASAPVPEAARMAAPAPAAAVPPAAPHSISAPPMIRNILMPVFPENGSSPGL